MPKGHPGGTLGSPHAALPNSSRLGILLRFVPLGRRRWLPRAASKIRHNRRAGPRRRFSEVRFEMSIDKTLAAKAALIRSRNVMTREERILELTRQGKFDDDSSPFGLPKVRVMKVKKRTKKKKEKKEEK